jgi:hypothetical protein
MTDMSAGIVAVIETVDNRVGVIFGRAAFERVFEGGYRRGVPGAQFAPPSTPVVSTASVDRVVLTSLKRFNSFGQCSSSVTARSFLRFSSR